MDLKTVLIFVIAFIGKSAGQQLRCYACSFSSSDSDQSCLTITDDTNTVDCPFTYCTIFRQDSHYSDANAEVGESPRNCSAEPIYNNARHRSDHTHNDDENNPKCCRTFFRRSRPRSLVENHPPKEETHSRDCSPCNNSNTLSDQTISCSQSKSEDIPKATIKFPKKDDPRKCFEHSGSFEGIKTKNKLLEKRLSADHLITSESKSLYRSSSPESDRSCSLDRKRRSKSTIARSSSRAGSTDSLARNSLLAAQVLRLIPTQEARE
ncbi:72 kDa inositol polyphosphate 5-phosphatase, partial [Operophtera brumata]